MPAFNAINRGVYIADNIYFLKSLNDECIDLVCIDPPFAKNETFGRKNQRDKDPLKPPLTDAERTNEFRLLADWGIQNKTDAEKAGIDWPETAYQDFWNWGKDVHESWLLELQENYEPIAALIEVTRHTHSDSTAAYLCYMAIRLIEIRRILKPTGSLYLHCDHTANGYLRQLLDAVFAPDNFKAEIIWGRSPGRNTGNKWGNTHDSILQYTKTDAPTWRPIHSAAANIKPTRVPLTAAGITRTGESGQPWRGYNPTEIGRHWGVPRTGELADWIHNNAIPGFKEIESIKERLDALAEAGLIHWSTGNTPSILRPPEADIGVKVNDIWTDIKLLSPSSNERAGYPTQKPVALAERIIKASTNPGDVVLDCFAGCAYVAVAAERLQRQWVACDIQPRAWTVFKRQFNKPNLALLTCADHAAPGQQVTPDNPIVTIHGPNQLPTRTSPETETPPPVFRLPERTFKVPASIIPEPQMLEELLKLSNYQAWCCGFANRRPDGRIIQTTRNFHLDHIAPKSKQNTGTSNDIQNRAPMCPYHNLRKNNRRIPLAEYRQEIAHAGELMVDTINDLINLDWAQAQAMQIYGQAYARQNPMGL